MKISIITPSFNSASTIADTINSVLSQDYFDIEYIIVDGGSKDSTVKIIKSYGEKIAKFVSEKDNGIYDAMNKGIKMASGDVVGILNSDDFYPDASVISDVAKAFNINMSDSVYGDLDYVDWDETTKIIRKWRAGKHTWKSFKFGWHPPHPTFFVKKELYDRLGLFREDLRIAADYELMLRFIYINKITMTYIPKVLVKMRDGGASSSGLSARKTTYIEDAKGWSFNNLKPSVLALTMKRVRKLTQWLR